MVMVIAENLNKFILVVTIFLLSLSKPISVVFFWSFCSTNNSRPIVQAADLGVFPEGWPEIVTSALSSQGVLTCLDNFMFNKQTETYCKRPFITGNKGLKSGAFFLHEKSEASM